MNTSNSELEKGISGNKDPKEQIKILNPELKKDLLEGKSIRLNFGAGKSPRPGFYSVDHIEMDGIDAVADLNKPLQAIPNDCCEYIYSRHTLEHIHEFLPLMQEIHRITKPEGTIEIIVPHFSNVYGYSDPTHVRFFGLYSMYYFVAKENQPKIRRVPAFYTDKKFQIESLTIEFYQTSRLDRLLAPIFTKLVNYNISTQDFYERRLSHFFHAWQIRYILTPEK
ncbi:MAG: class I SAM-dependent methyltransferase [Kangiellaceae bacterium]|nr:class I SAM-dependent methyltransferase [Kangiellaceae bacterium]